MACFWISGNQPWLRDALTITVTYGVSRSTYSRTRKVGSGSREQDLTGEDMMIRRYSLLCLPTEGWPG